MGKSLLFKVVNEYSDAALYDCIESIVEKPQELYGVLSILSSEAHSLLHYSVYSHSTRLSFPNTNSHSKTSVFIFHFIFLTQKL